MLFRSPKWLDRIIPNVDVEGSALERRHPVHYSHPDADAPVTADAPEPAGVR